MAEGVEEAIEAKGAILFYLPAYSPDFNPIEQFVCQAQVHASQNCRIFSQANGVHRREFMQGHRLVSDRDHSIRMHRIPSQLRIWSILSGNALDKKLPNWVAPRINHTDANLHPFYAHLEKGA
jgi:hypothetical protein